MDENTELLDDQNIIKTINSFYQEFEDRLPEEKIEEFINNKFFPFLIKHKQFTEFDIERIQFKRRA